MKTLLLALCLGFATALHAAPPAPALAVSVEVEMRQPKTVNETTYGVTPWGSYNKNFTAQRGARVRLKLFGAFDPHVTLRWAFIARRPQGGLFAWDRGSAEIEITKGAPAIEIISKELTGSDLNLRTVDHRRTKGGKPHGFVIVVQQGGRVLAVKESSAGLLALLDAP